MSKKAAATGAGAGVLYIAFAKFYFMMAGLVVQVNLLPRILSHAAWGSFSFVNSLVSPVNNVLVTGSIQAVSKFAAAEPEKARRVQQAGFRMHVRLGLVVAVLFIAGAPVVAWIFKDSSKTTPLMIGGLILGGNAFYAVFVGTANGLRQFQKQAGLDITFATLRSIGLVGMAMAGLGVVGVVGGWAAAVGAIVMISAAWIGLPGRDGDIGERLPVRPMIKFFGGVAVYLILFNALMFVDTWLIKRLTTDYYASHMKELKDGVMQVLPWAPDVTGYHPDASVLADVRVGYYAAVQNLARLSYQAIIAATFVVFPLVSRSTFTDDKDTTKRYIEVTIRYSLIFAMAIAVVMAANPADILKLIYAGAPEYAQQGQWTLAFLAIGNVAFSIFAIAGTILNSAGLSRIAIATAGITLAIAAIGNAIVIPMVVDSGHTLEAAAAVTGSAMVIGAVMTGVMLRRKLGAFIPAASLVRIIAATAIAMGVGYVLPLHGKLMTLVEAIIVGVTFLVVLVGSRELGKRDLDAIKAVRKKRAPGGGDA
ncbi:MAG TPA: oligosaccharide flippase family protein [Kofleriaceae bacterium]|nr:oligosaccharide flippase family protein [Kofleriaceae bacterium]